MNNQPFGSERERDIVSYLAVLAVCHELPDERYTGTTNRALEHQTMEEKSSRGAQSSALPLYIDTLRNREDQVHQRSDLDSDLIPHVQSLQSRRGEETRTRRVEVRTRKDYD